jgi:prevent-host-death family protein
MTIFADFQSPRALSVTAATSRGVAGLVKDAEMGEDVLVERHGRAVAAVVSVEHFEQLQRTRADVSSAALILARELTDTGNRVSLDDALSAFGVDRAELEAELDADIAAGHS